MNDLRRTLSTLGLMVALWSLPVVAASAADGPRPSVPAYLYKTTFVRAAPGRLLELIDLYKSRMAVMDAASDPRPLWWRHTQGDQWDLMLLYPMENYTAYYARARVSRREKAAAASPLPEREFVRQLQSCTSRHEDVFVMGPPLETVKKAFEAAAYYHVEIFISLPGKQAALYKEREMENAYAVGNGRPENLIFVRDQGAAWDLYTLGCYRDLQHWAEPSPLTKGQRDEAARRAGFSGADAIGPYMRTLIDWHRDTMGVAIR